MATKTTFSKKQVEQNLMLRLRMDMMLLESGVPEGYREKLLQRVDAGLRAIGDRISLYGPSAWFQEFFIDKHTWFAGYRWKASQQGHQLKVEVLESEQPSIKKVVAL